MSVDNQKIRVAVLSDLHVGDNEKNSFLTNSTPETPHENPFVSLTDFITRNSIQADILICCGDMTDQANITGQKYVWDKIHRLAETLNAREVFGTAGNHDMDSRGSNSYDPKGSLLDLDPSFPYKNEQYSNHYWAKNFAFSTHGNVRLLNVNSSAFHGYITQNIQQYQMGRISQSTVDRIELLLQQHEEYPVNIAFFHHHPIRWTTRTDEDYSEMDGGDRLIRLLSQSQYGSWIIIHGHKHWPDIQVAGGASNPPVVFAAGSFSSKRLAGDNGSHKNQFYILEIDMQPEIHNLSIAGKIYAWNWANGAGWSPAFFEDGIPYGCGFSNSQSTPRVLAKRIDEYAKEQLYVSWSELTDNIQELNYTLPKNIGETCQLLKNNYLYEITYDDLHWPKQLSKQHPTEIGDNS